MMERKFFRYFLKNSLSLLGSFKIKDSDKIFYVFIYVFVKRYKRPPDIRELSVITGISCETCRKYIRKLKVVKLISKKRTVYESPFFTDSNTKHKKTYIKPTLKIEDKKEIDCVNEIIQAHVNEYFLKKKININSYKINIFTRINKIFTFI